MGVYEDLKKTEKLYNSVYGIEKQHKVSILKEKLPLAPYPLAKWENLHEDLQVTLTVYPDIFNRIQQAYNTVVNTEAKVLMNSSPDTAKQILNDRKKIYPHVTSWAKAQKHLREIRKVAK